MNYDARPTLWCMLLHQSVWIDEGEDQENNNWYHCPHCDDWFIY